MEKDPSTWSALSAAIAAIAALLGGVIDYHEQWMQTRCFKLGAFIYSMFVACGMGLLAFWVAKSALGQPDAICACAAAVAGNLGESVFDLVRHWLLHQQGIKHDDADYNLSEHKKDENHD